MKEGYGNPILNCIQPDNLLTPKEQELIHLKLMDFVQRISWRLPCTPNKKNKLIIHSELILGAIVPMIDRSMAAHIKIERIADDALLTTKRVRTVLNYLASIEVARYKLGTVQLLSGPNMLDIDQIIQHVPLEKL